VSMPTPVPRARAVVPLVLLALAAVLLSTPGVARAAGALSFDGTFEDGLTAWNLGGGGPQCANTGTTSNNQRLRGNFFVETSVAGEGAASGRFDLPPSQMPNFPLEACELTHPVPLGLGTDGYYGYMFYVPVGWTTGTSAFWGVTTAQWHFQNIWGSPLEFQLENDHMTLAIETGACDDYTTSTPGCQYRSNADDGGCRSSATVTCLAPQYVVPPGMEQGVWHEVVMHVHWASDSTGQIEVWTRVEGQTAWTQTVEVSGIPTVQWDVTQGCCLAQATDKVGAYRGYATVPVSVWLDDIVDGPDFATVAAAMPTAPGAPSGGGTGSGSGGGGTESGSGGGGTGSGSGGGGTGSGLGGGAPAPPRRQAGATAASGTRRRPVTARSARAHTKVFASRCVAPAVRRAWLRHHPRAGAARRQVLAMRRVAVRRHGRRQAVYCS